MEEIESEQFLNAVVTNAMPSALTTTQVAAAKDRDSTLYELRDWIKSGRNMPHLPTVWWPITVLLMSSIRMKAEFF